MLYPATITCILPRILCHLGPDLYKKNTHTTKPSPKCSPVENCTDKHGTALPWHAYIFLHTFTCTRQHVNNVQTYARKSNSGIAYELCNYAKPSVSELQLYSVGLSRYLGQANGSVSLLVEFYSKAYGMRLFCALRLSPKLFVMLWFLFLLQPKKRVFLVRLLPFCT